MFNFNAQTEVVVRRLLTVAASLVLLAARSAMAADLTVRALARTFVPAYGWAGCYVGAEGGAAWGQSRRATP